MGARRISNKERKKAGNIYCSFCRPIKIQAIYRFHWEKFACENHKQKIERLVEIENYWNNREPTEYDLKRF